MIDKIKTTRILLVGPGIPPYGGQSVQLAKLQSRLAEVSSLSVGFVPNNPKFPKPLRALERIKYVRTLTTLLIHVSQLLTTTPRYDVVHVFSAAYWSFVVSALPAMVIARLFGKRLVLNYHSGEAEDHLKRWGQLAIRPMRLAHQIVVPSGYLVKVFANFGLPARAVFNFIEADQFPFRYRREFAPVVLSNRNLQPLYNVACTIRGFAQILPQFPEARLIVVGSGPDRPALEKLIADLGVRNIEFRGPVSQNEMISIYGQADIFVSTPNVDNMPMSLLEAFAAGLPVVSTNVGGVPYLITDGFTGLLIPPDDDKALATAIARIVREPEFGAQLTHNARTEIEHKYVWDAVRSLWLSVYQAKNGVVGTRAAP